MERRLDHALADARKVNAAAKRHAKPLTTRGVTAAQITLHAKLIEDVTTAFARRDAAAQAVAEVVDSIAGARESAIDIVMDASRAAHLAFASPEHKDAATGRKFGMSARPPKGLAALERSRDQLAEAFKDADAKARMEKVGAKATLVTDLSKHIAALRAAEEKKAALGTERRRQAQQLQTSEQSMRGWTTQFRVAGNLAFKGKPEQAEFDPPPRPPVKTRAKPDTPPVPPAPGHSILASIEARRSA